MNSKVKKSDVNLKLKKVQTKPELVLQIRTLQQTIEALENTNRNLQEQIKSFEKKTKSLQNVS